MHERAEHGDAYHGAYKGRLDPRQVGQGYLAITTAHSGVVQSQSTDKGISQ
jgi:hypothetical protein